MLLKGEVRYGQRGIIRRIMRIFLDALSMGTGLRIGTMNQQSGKQANRITRVLMMALTVVLIVLFFNIMSLVADIQGTARVVNYAGLVRGTTQRIVKLEDAQQQQDKLLEAVDSYIDGLRYGSSSLDLVRLDDDAFQQKMTKLAEYFDGLREEIYLVRSEGYESTDIIAKSEEFFGICDKATELAEDYSQQKATALNHLENVVVADIVGLLVLFAIELARALRTAALNRQLQKKVYLDEATGLPNKNKCEEILAEPDVISADSPVALCVFDLNNLRTINNNLGHEKGDEYIRSFALQLQKVASERCFVGRDGGDEFIAVLREADRASAEACLAEIHAHADTYSAEHPAMPISYAAGYALSSDFDSCTMRDLFRQADKNMYIDKDKAKMREAAERQREGRRILEELDLRGFHFADCLYCDALLDQYRVLRASSDMFLAEDGSFSGAAEQIAHELAAGDDVAALRRALQLDAVRHSIAKQGDTVQVLYHNGKRRGRLTLVFLDATDGTLHHFAVGFEPFHAQDATEKQQLSRYYDQFKQSILENGNYVDALLESAQAAYAVDLTHNKLETVFSQPSENRYDLGMEPPCSYNSYCKLHSEHVTKETLENYRLVDTSEKLLRRFESGTKQLTIEYQEEGRNGQAIWLQKIVLMSRDAVFDAKTATETPVVRGIIMFKDTSAFHEQEQREKERLERELQTADSENKAKTEFMNRMSHDFRTPINGILGMLEIIDAHDQEPEKTRECLGKIRVSADHLLDLVNDVLDMSKLESGQAVLEQDRFNLEELMREVHTLVDAQMQEAGIVHHRHRNSIAHSNLIGSDLRLRQIMLNLFSNAVKYNKPGGSVDTYARELSDDGETALFEFTIRDTGIGMSRDFVENQLFKPFTQEQFGARTQYKGTGLGMSIVKTLIDAMGGTISVQSEPNVGTTITFCLAFKIDKAAQSEEPALAAPTEYVSLAGKRVLLVEDNELNMEIAEFYLDSAGATVIKAWNGKEAVRAFSGSKPGAFSLILMDLMMPVMDGLEATRIIRALDRPDAYSVPIIAMTANAFDEDREKTKAAGMNAHLVKPLDMRVLLEAVGRFCK